MPSWLSGRAPRAEKSAAYEPLHNGSSLDGEQTDSFRQEATQKAILKLCRQIRLLLAGCVVLLVFLGLALVALANRPTSQTRSERAAVDVDEKLFAPEFPLIAKTFIQKPEFSTLSDEILQEWHMDLPRGSGFVVVPTGPGTNETYVVSIFHQLHCLFNMQHSYASAIEHPEKVTEDDRTHFYHCGELLRQALKCNADPTFDSTHWASDEHLARATNGWNGRHICHDWDRLYQWTDEHRLDDHRDGMI